MLVVKKVLPYIFIIAILSYVLNLAFNYDNQLLHLTEINGIKFYTFDLRSYLYHIQQIWESYIPTWEDLSLPSYTEIKPWPSSLDILGYFRVFGNNLFVVLSWLMAPISILTWFGNFILFAIQMLLALIGIPENSIFYYVIQFCKDLANIPNYIINGLNALL